MTPDYIAIYLVVAGILYGPAGGEDFACHHGWYLFEGACYGIGSEALTWAGAQEFCEVFNAHLAEVETSAENEYLKNLARTHMLSTAWIGGTDIFEEGYWEWAASGVPIQGFTDWAPGEPNQQGGIGGEDCLQLQSAAGYKWNDEDCEDSAFFFCEAEILGTIVVG